MYYDRQCQKIISGKSSNKGWWKNVKYFMKGNHKPLTSAIEHCGITYSDNQSKTEILNSYF